MEKLKKTIQLIYNDDLQLNLNEYNSLIYKCVSIYEMTAVVFLYDHMKKNGIEPSEETFKLINKLHSKKCPENNNIIIPNQNVGKLKPRRRIHKIIPVGTNTSLLKMRVGFSFYSNGSKNQYRNKDNRSYVGKK